MAAYRRVDDLTVTCTPGSSPGPTLGIEYGKAFTFLPLQRKRRYANFMKVPHKRKSGKKLPNFTKFAPSRQVASIVIPRRDGKQKPKTALSVTSTSYCYQIQWGLMNNNGGRRANLHAERDMFTFCSVVQYTFQK